MKNRIEDLNNYLFESIEWLSDMDVKGEELEEVIRRAREKCEVARHLIELGRLSLDAAKLTNVIPERSKRHFLLE
ncbi:MAG: hypothetical protein LBI86_00240 [Treponema sp.]|nr:hypothetical protein [Treponema sp.]